MYARPSLWTQYALPPTYFGTLRNLIGAVDGDEELLVSLEDGLAIVALIEATERSIATGRPVDPRPLMALA
jgi:predicted dehydrogenase